MAKSWVGSIYHKFEAICQEVDDLMNKDTIKFTENRVQSVGASVKNVCSDLVQDELPPSGNDVKDNTQLATGKQADMTGQVKSTTSIMMKSECTKEKQLCLENCFCDSLNICNTSPGDIDLEICRKKPVSENYSVDVKTDSSLQLVGVTMICNDLVNNVEEETAKVTIPISSDSSSKNEVLAMTFDDDNQHDQDLWNTKWGMDSSSPAPSVHDAELLALKPQRSLWDSFSDETEYFSNISRTGLLPVGESSLVQDLDLDENRKIPEHVTPATDSSNSLTLDVAEGDSRKDGTVCCSYSIKDECFTVSDATQTPKLVSSNYSCNSAETRMGVISFCHSTSSESPSLLDSLGAKNNQTTENIHNTHLLSYGRGFDVCDDTCPLLPATGSQEIKPVDTAPALLITESSDGHASTTHGRFSVGSSEGNFNICTRIDDLNLETIDLSNSVKPDVWNDNFVPTTSYRPKNYMYYKKLIQHAFASRKRLSKEYELLPVLYGDLEMDLKNRFEQSSLPSSTRSQLPQTSDSEWELL